MDQEGRARLDRALSQALQTLSEPVPLTLMPAGADGTLVFASRRPQGAAPDCPGAGGDAATASGSLGAPLVTSAF